MREKFGKKKSQKEVPQSNTAIEKSCQKELDRANTGTTSNVEALDTRTSSGPTQILTVSVRPSPFSSSNNYRETGSDSFKQGKRSLGLQIVHQPGQRAPLDIIFVHGLGGHPLKTWCKNHDPKFFWPGLWLPDDVEVGDARIFTFGYNADFRPGSGRNIANISSFAKELLFEMRFGKDNEDEDLELGKAPIVFVVHSMGGLVMKKAALLGRNDKTYSSMINSIAAVVFLGTPHRGSGLAEVLKKLLSVSLQAPRAFINDLCKNSSALEEINESFRHIASELSIMSFYETEATKIGGKRLMIVETDSSVLGKSSILLVHSVPFYETSLLPSWLLEKAARVFNLRSKLA
jgi:pimeloyl-ACP methyl ester carboxylesterase